MLASAGRTGKSGNGIHCGGSLQCTTHEVSATPVTHRPLSDPDASWHSMMQGGRAEGTESLKLCSFWRKRSARFCWETSEK